MKLTEKKCKPCEVGGPSLEADVAKKMMKEIAGWNLATDSKQISREFVFKDFKEALAFINRVADVAESENHHPDIHNFWNKVRLDLSTHAVKGLSENDFILAAKVNALK